MQGRFKRDGSAEGAPEARGSADRPQPQRAQDGGPVGGDQGTPPGRPVSAEQNAAAGTPERTGKPGKAGKNDKAGKETKAGKDATPPGTGDAPDVPDPGSRMALRNWRISTRLVSLLALPVIAATTLGGMRISDSLQNVDQLDKMKLLTKMTEQATELAAALQEERDRSAGPLVSTGNDKDDTVVASREKTDKAFRSFKKATGDVDGTDKAMAGVQSTVLDITRQLTAINTIRERAYENPEYVSQTVNSYNQLIESLLSLSQDMAQATSNSEMIRSTRALAAFSSAKEYASIQRAIISAGLAHQPTPKLSESDRLYARTATDSEGAELDSFGQIYGDKATADLLKPISGGDVNVVMADKYRDRMLHSPDAIKKQRRTYVDWMDQDTSKLGAMDKIERTLLEKMEQQARELRSEAQREAFISGALILLVLGISLVGAFVVARSMVRSLRRLQDTAQDVARRRLPELVKQMSEAEPQDVDTSVESVGVHSRDEIGKVAAAFDDVHREAVRLAGEQALLRGNVNAMFTNLSRRSQGLIQRQLSLISELESREADPDQLSSLFKLDHLATRMRRNGENLLVLAGEEPGRRWTRPVPLVDVLRAAASEVEQYERIELNSVPATEVAGRVVNDLVHLLAELLENATSFSSPQTKVKVTGHALPDGRVLIEIHDTGIGLSPEDLSAINERLANPPTVDVSVSRRMGLFVVGRLSLRHGIRIQLRPSDSGGTTALVMLPVDIAQGGGQGPKGRPGAAGAPGASGPQGGPSPAQARGGSKGGNLAAALQRGPQSGGPGTPGFGAGAGAGAGTGAGAGASGGPGTSRLGALPTRQSGAGSRAALSGGGPQGGGSGGSSVNFFGAPPNPGRPGQAPAGPGGAGKGTNPPLPTRGRGPAAQLPGGSRAPADTGRSPQAGSPSDGPGSTTEIPRITPDGPADTGQYDRPAATGQFALPQSGSPADTGQYPQPGPVSEGPGSTSEIPRISPDGPGGTGRFDRPSDTGQYPRPSDTGEYAQPSETGEFRQPSETGQFAQPGGAGQFALPQAGGSSDTGQYPQLSDTGEYRQPSDTGEYAQPSDTGEYQRPSDTGQFAQPGGTGQFALPQAGSPSDTGQYERPGDTGQYPRPTDTGEYAQPSDTGQYPQPTDTGQYPGPSDTGEYAQPSETGEFRQPSETGQFAQPGGAGQFALPQAAGPADTGEYAQPGGPDGPGHTGQFPQADGVQSRPSWARPERGPGDEDGPRGHDEPEGTGEYAQPGIPGTAQADGIPSGPPAPADAPTPIFASMESNWFRGAQQPAQQAQPQAGSPHQADGAGTDGGGSRLSPASVARPGQPASAVPPLPQRRTGQDAAEISGGTAQDGAAPGAVGGNWGASPNDERWRRAEQIRQPAAGGVTTSGLPRRVPRANLVAGTAQQQSPAQSGPQVSRAPDDVRGRLTNLRRGVQQGRQAGTDNRGAGPTYQQER
ncbi:sensor histidine kinase [Streptomyces albus]|uniref:sensor histidine kinase n=1 Tax=Streptomyces albus TaxID=1888 RepID=UPI0034548428